MILMPCVKESDLSRRAFFIKTKIPHFKRSAEKARIKYTIRIPN